MPKVYYIVPQKLIYLDPDIFHFHIQCRITAIFKKYFLEETCFLSEKSGLAVFLSWSICCSRFLEMLLQSCFKQFAAVLTMTGLQQIFQNMTAANDPKQDCSKWSKT
jgi:hypothetical protein